jgi:hypothetical protein
MEKCAILTGQWEQREGLSNFQHRRSACLTSLCDLPALPMICLVSYGWPCCGDV